MPRDNEDSPLVSPEAAHLFLQARSTSTGSHTDEQAGSVFGDFYDTAVEGMRKGPLLETVEIESQNGIKEYEREDERTDEENERVDSMVNASRNQNVTGNGRVAGGRRLEEEEDNWSDYYRQCLQDVDKQWGSVEGVLTGRSYPIDAFHALDSEDGGKDDGRARGLSAPQSSNIGRPATALPQRRQRSALPETVQPRPATARYASHDQRSPAASRHRIVETERIVESGREPSRRIERPANQWREGALDPYQPAPYMERYPSHYHQWSGGVPLPPRGGYDYYADPYAQGPPRAWGDFGDHAYYRGPTRAYQPYYGMQPEYPYGYGHSYAPYPPEPRHLYERDVYEWRDRYGYPVRYPEDAYGSTWDSTVQNGGQHGWNVGYNAAERPPPSPPGEMNLGGRADVRPVSAQYLSVDDRVGAQARRGSSVDEVASLNRRPSTDVDEDEHPAEVAAAHLRPGMQPKERPISRKPQLDPVSPYRQMRHTTPPDTPDVLAVEAEEEASVEEARPMSSRPTAANRESREQQRANAEATPSNDLLRMFRDFLAKNAPPVPEFLGRLVDSSQIGRDDRESVELGEGEKELGNVLLSWYYAGYFTGRYRATMEAETGRQGRVPGEASWERAVNPSEFPDGIACEEKEENDSDEEEDELESVVPSLRRPTQRGVGGQNHISSDVLNVEEEEEELSEEDNEEDAFWKDGRPPTRGGEGFDLEVPTGIVAQKEGEETPDNYDEQESYTETLGEDRSTLHSSSTQEDAAKDRLASLNLSTTDQDPLDQKTIEVAVQARVSREDARRALLDNNGDVINAIMFLSAQNGNDKE